MQERSVFLSTALRKRPKSSKMEILVAALVFAVGIAMASAAVPGGERPINEEDFDNVEKAKTLIISYLHAQVGADPCYNTNVTLSDEEIKKQVVAGIRYNLKFKATFNNTCVNDPQSNCLCKEKAKVEKTCKASVWIPVGRNQKLQFTNGGEPRCLLCSY